MKKLFTLLAFLSIAVSSICQDVYPKLIIIDNDTLVLLTPIQVKKINATILRLDECRKITTSLEQENKELILKYSILNKEIENLKKQNEISDRIDLEIFLLPKIKRRIKR